MLVLYQNEIFTLNMQYCTFDALRSHDPDLEVEVETFTESSYKQVKKIPIGELNDYSVERNKLALGL